MPMTAILNPGKNDVVITVDDGSHTTDYTVSLYCDYDAPTTVSSELATIEVDGEVITINAGQTEYTATHKITVENSDVEAKFPGTNTGEITIKVNGATEAGPTSGSSLKATGVAWKAGTNTVEVTAEESGKSPITYTVTIECEWDASQLTELWIDSVNYIDSDGQLTQSEVKVTKDNSDLIFKTANYEDGTFYIDDGNVDQSSWTNGITWIGDWKWSDGVTSRELKVTVKETNKTETTYTLTIVDDRDPSELENYLTIEGTPVMFNSEHKGSASPLKQESDVMIVLKNGPTVDAIKIELNGTELTNGTDGTDGAGNPTKEFFGTDAIKWTAENNELKITLRYEDHKETTYTVAVTCQPVDVTLKEFKIGANSYSVTGATGLTMHAGETISAATTDPNATVEVTVYGGANGPSTFPTTPGNSAVGTEGTSKDFQWNTSGGEESIRIEVIVKNGAHTSDPYVYTGKFEEDTSLAQFKIGSTIYPPTGYSGITMNSGEAITATANAASATITLKISGDGVGPWMFPSSGNTITKTEGTDFDWAASSGSNTIEVTVTNGSATSTYIFSGTTA